ncbi:MAG: hypothetical protein M0P21_05495 [Methanoculleus sp.]|nr:hypothetical protein [Methanoculleus sp.]
MNPNFSRTLILVAVLCVLFTAVQAAEVRLADGQLIVAGVDDSIGLGGFNVVLSYGSDVSVTSVEGLSGFLVASNIRNDAGMTIIAGISADGLTGDVPVASVQVEGTGPIAIAVRELGNARGDPIAFTNPTFGGTIPTPETSTPGTPAPGTPTAGSVTPVPTPTGMPQTTVTPAPGETGQIGATTTATTTTTTASQEASPTQVGETPESHGAAESTPKAALPVLIAFIAVLTVVVLNGKE